MTVKKEASASKITAKGHKRERKTSKVGSAISVSIGKKPLKMIAKIINAKAKFLKPT